MRCSNSTVTREIKSKTMRCHYTYESGNVRWQLGDTARMWARSTHLPLVGCSLAGSLWRGTRHQFDQLGLHDPATFLLVCISLGHSHGGT